LLEFDLPCLDVGDEGWRNEYTIEVHVLGDLTNIINRVASETVIFVTPPFPTFSMAWPMRLLMWASPYAEIVAI
jgi:hypothetical protein